MTRLVLDHAFGAVGLQVEGRRRAALLWDGVRYDALLMSVLATDPR